MASTDSSLVAVIDTSLVVKSARDIKRGSRCRRHSTFSDCHGVNVRVTASRLRLVPLATVIVPVALRHYRSG